MCSYLPDITKPWGLWMCVWFVCSSFQLKLPLGIQSAKHLECTGFSGLKQSAHWKLSGTLRVETLHRGSSDWLSTQSSARQHTWWSKTAKRTSAPNRRRCHTSTYDNWWRRARASASWDAWVAIWMSTLVRFRLRKNSLRQAAWFLRFLIFRVTSRTWFFDACKTKGGVFCYTG